MRRIVIGIDEAGYGPKIGPLVIGASVWSIPYDLEADQLLELLAPEFQSKPWNPKASFIPLGDSKAIYQNKKHFDSLCIPIRFLLDLCGCVCESTSRLIHQTSHTDAPRVEEKPWYAPSLEDRSWESLPVSQFSADAARAKLRLLGIEFHGFLCRIFDEEEFNAAVAKAGNKANVLGEGSLSLLRDCIAFYCKPIGDNTPMHVEACCDRQGGRKNYLPLLNQAFAVSRPWFDVLEETSQCSRYQGRIDGIDLQVRFPVGGDSLLPTGVASILAKFVRELLMLRLNRYWRDLVGEELKPTAGYPVDAERFRTAIEKSATQMAYPCHRWWRCC